MKTSARSPLSSQLCVGLVILWSLLSTLTAYGEAQIDRAALKQALSAHRVDVSAVFFTNTDPVSYTHLTLPTKA